MLNKVTIKIDRKAALAFLIGARHLCHPSHDRRTDNRITFNTVQCTRMQCTKCTPKPKPTTFNHKSLPSAAIRSFRDRPYPQKA